VTDDSPAAGIDTTVSHSARVWNYWLGGKDHYPFVTLRSPEQIAAFFEGLELLEPGVVSTTRWRPDVTSAGQDPPKWISSARSGASRSPGPRSSVGSK